MAVLELLPSKNEWLLIDGNPFLFLDLISEIIGSFRTRPPKQSSFHPKSPQRSALGRWWKVVADSSFSRGRERAYRRDRIGETPITPRQNKQVIYTLQTHMHNASASTLRTPREPYRLRCESTYSQSPEALGILSYRLRTASGELPRFAAEQLQTTRPRPSVMNGGSWCRVSVAPPGSSLADDGTLAVAPTSVEGGASDSED